jgi:tetratricopeptide (TPR) repeat protein
MTSERKRSRAVSGAAAWLPALVLALALAACAKSAPTAQSYFDEGARLFQSGDYDAAIAAYERGLLLEPRSAVGQNLVGMAYRFKYNAVRDSRYKDKEIAAFEAAVVADSTFAPALINLGATLYYLGRKPEAALHFRRALAVNPDNPEREQLEGFIREGGLEPPVR